MSGAAPRAVGGHDYSRLVVPPQGRGVGGSGAPSSVPGVFASASPATALGAWSGEQRRTLWERVVLYRAAGEARLTACERAGGALELASWAALSAVWSAVFTLPICGLIFRCGCTWSWAGGVSRCNVWNPTGPHCPWCVATAPLSWIPQWGGMLASLTASLAVRHSWMRRAAAARAAAAAAAGAVASAYDSFRAPPTPDLRRSRSDKTSAASSTSSYSAATGEGEYGDEGDQVDPYDTSSADTISVIGPTPGALQRQRTATLSSSEAPVATARAVAARVAVVLGALALSYVLFEIITGFVFFLAYDYPYFLFVDTSKKQ